MIKLPLFLFMRWLLVCAGICTGLSGAAAAAQSQAHWPQWRGPGGTGSVSDAHAPTNWSEDENIRWKVDLPGKGSSTPVIFGDRIFVTTAIATDRGADGKPVPAAEDDGPSRGRIVTPTRIHEFWVLCLQRQTGAMRWETKVTETVPHEGGHPTNTMASPSPVTDGEHVFAFFGSRGLFCLDLDGEVIWSKEFGHMQTRREFGEGASVAVRGDNLVLVWDHEGPDFIACLDKHTGEERWRTERDQVTTWDTPVITPVGDGEQVIVTGTTASRAYDMDSGEAVWWIGGMTTNCIPSPIVRDGRAWLMSGFRGSALQAIDLEGARGNLAGTEQLAWSLGSNTSYVPSALLHREHLYFLRGNTGVLSCVEAGTGDVIYSGQRLGDIRAVYASPIGVGDHLYIVSRKGLTVVVAAGEEFSLVAANELDDTFDASPVFADGALYLRGWNRLYCVAEEESSD